MEGNTAWMLISTALVLFMVPGLALFYGGMVRSKNVLNMLNMNTYCLGIVPLVWVLVAFSLGNSGDGDGLEAVIGNLAEERMQADGIRRGEPAIDGA